MESVREKRLEALLLQALGREGTLEELHAALKPLCPGLTKARLFALLVRLKREGKVAFQGGRFRLAGEDQGADP
ncbi:hypothetical protein [Thermus sp.]|uniref:hypothetical protein n=1 Tax=Thermus sp. TaxID=275 RepID=UPI003D1241B8